MTIHDRRTTAPHAGRADLTNFKRMWPFVWDYRGRVLLALVCLIIAKLATVGVPLVLKEIVDALDAAEGKTLVLPITLLLA